jgi:hypothetical protein
MIKRRKEVPSLTMPTIYKGKITLRKKGVRITIFFLTNVSHIGFRVRPGMTVSVVLSSSLLIKG